MNKDFDKMFSLHNLSSLDFERFALNIIEYEAASQKKEIYRENRGAQLLVDSFNLENKYRFVFDAIAPHGIYDSRLTFVEVRKTNPSIPEAVNQIIRIFSIYKKIVLNQQKKSFINYNNTKLLIVISSGNGVKQAFYEKNREDLIDIWSIEDLIEKAKSYPFEYNAFLELAVSRFSKNEIIKAIKDESEFITNKDFEAQNNSLIAELSNSFKKNRISLILGTGVSMVYNNGLSWSALSDKLYDCLDSDKKFINDKESISMLGGDSVSSTQYSIRNLSNRYPTVLYNLIYPQKNAYIKGNSTLDECVDLIKRKNYEKQRVSKVITYNYDDYLEQALKARSLPFHVLYRPTDYNNETIPIYHVHGYMPEMCKYAERQEYIKTVVLSEEDYFNCYGDSSNWNVAIQLETFKDDVCLFVGNSITDFNEKRLLNRTRQEKEKSHFAIIHTRGLGYADLTKIYMHFFYELNVKIIWAKNLNDIPRLISKI